MKTKISSSEDFGTVVTLIAETIEEARALKDLWCDHGGLSSYHEKGQQLGPGDELELATETQGE